MRHPSRLAAFALAALAVAAVPAIDASDDTALAEGCRLVDIADTPDDDTDDVTICEQQQWVRAGDAPISNVAAAEFSTEAPSTPAAGGAALGGSATDIVLQGDPGHGLEVTGTFTGAVDTLKLEVYLAMPNGASGSHGTTPVIAIDGFDVAGQLIATTVTPGPVPGTAMATIEITDLLSLWELARFSFDPEAEHTLRVNLSPYYIGDDGAYLYDGTDVPSNVHLNAAS